MTTLADRVRNFASLQKLNIEIQLNDDNGVLQTFSSNDRIEGTVTVTASVERDSRLHDMEIAFVGKLWPG